jgi:hypothetical protein
VKPGDLVVTTERCTLWKDDPWSGIAGVSDSNIVQSMNVGEVGMVISNTTSNIRLFCIFGDKIGFIMAYLLRNA